MEYQEFRDIVGSATTVMEATNCSPEQTVVSTNGILPGSRYTEYNYPYAIGIKTGHTSVAGYCLVSAADKEGTRLLCVVMGTSGRLTSFAETIKLFEWGYDNYDMLTYGQEPETDPFEDAQSALESAARQDAELAAEPPAVPSSVPSVTPAPTESAQITPAVSTAPQAGLFSGSSLLPAACIAIAVLLTLVLLVVVIIAVVRR